MSNTTIDTKICSISTDPYVSISSTGAILNISNPTECLLVNTHIFPFPKLIQISMKRLNTQRTVFDEHRLTM